MDVPAISPVQILAYSFLGALVLLYVGMRTFMAVCMRGTAISAARLIVAQSVPVAVAAMTILAMGQPEMGVALVLAVSMANVTLVLGLIRLSGPVHEQEGAVSRAKRRLWGIVLPVALMLLIAGFLGRFTWLHATILLIEGVAIYSLVRANRVQLVHSMQHHEPLPVESIGNETPIVLRLLWGVAALVIVIVGVGLLETVMRMPGNVLYRMPPVLHASAIFAPILLLPVIGVLVVISQMGRGEVSASASIGATLVNLCLVLPMLVGFWWVCVNTPLRAWVAELLQRVPVGSTLSKVPEHLPFPMVSWRVDSMALVVAGVFLLGVSFHKLHFNKVTALLLVLAYMIFISINAAIGLLY